MLDTVRNQEAEETDILDETSENHADHPNMAYQLNQEEKEIINKQYPLILNDNGGEYCDNAEYQTL